MNIVPIANTNQLPKKPCISVQTYDEQDAIASLLAIAIRKKYELGEVIYKWSNCYFYAEVIAAEGTAK